MMTHTFIFICQQGELELKAALLAASLKYAIQGEFALIAAIPTPEQHWGTVSPETLQFLHALGVKTVNVENPISLDYPIGNKLACLEIATQTEISVFLDSDILCLQAFDPKTVFKAQTFCAKPADLATFSQQTTLWQQLYQKFNRPVPPWRVLTSVSRQLSMPYFNAGVLSVPTQANFGQYWRQCCQAIEADDNITNKRPWLDQIGLPLALAQSALPHDCLDERFNYPLHLKPLPERLPVLCHYHWSSCLRREPRLLDYLQDLVQHYPALADLFQRDAAWATLLQPYPQLNRQKKRFLSRQPQFHHAQPTAIITGIPRSGTSYLCRLLHQLPNSVVINEPSSIFPALQERYLPWGLALYHQMLRRDILDGQPVENKVKDGELVEDTVHYDERSLYLPTVNRADFALFTKNTLAYLARLPQIHSVLPDALILACIRHPLDTLLSWQHSFPHLQQADVANFPIGSPTDPHLTQAQHSRLQVIADTSDLCTKRALLWCFLAEQILANRHLLQLIQYEQLVQNPAQHLTDIWQQLPHAAKLKIPRTIQPSAPRYKRDRLSAVELQVIRDICGEIAYQFGYEL